MAVSQALVLFYDPQGTAAAARKVFLTRHIRVRTVEPEQAGQRVGALAGLKGWALEEIQAPSPPQQSVLVFSGVLGAQLDGVLTALRRAGVPPTVYKAVVTADNAGWTFAQLCEELTRERQAVEAGREAAHSRPGESP